MTLKIRLVVFILAGLFSVINSQGSGNDPVPVSVSFSRNPVKIGIGEKRHSETPDYPAGAVPAFSHRLKATITPVDKASEVSFDSSNASRATVEEVSRTVVDNKVEAILKVTGVSETSATAPAGDTDVQAKHQGSIIATTKVIVLKPTSRTHSVAAATFVNSFVQLATQTQLKSEATQIVTITIKDQFGDTLDSIYNGKDVVEEKFENITNGGLTPNWIPVAIPDNKLINGIKLDQAGAEQQADISPKLTNTQTTQWVAFTFKFYGTTGNNMFIFNGANFTTEGDMKLRVDGHDVTPDIHRKIVTTATDYPPIPFTLTETINP